jgi:MFS family permease
LSGFVGSAPLSNVAGTITDLVTTAQSGYAIALYALASVIGPALGSVTGGYPVEKLGWRWLFWIYAIVFGAHLIVIWLLMPETREDISKSKLMNARVFPSVC